VEERVVRVLITNKDRILEKKGGRQLATITL
jgi:hypothetical protein